VIVYPAIDLRGGRVVRLQQGDYAAQTSYPDDPLALAQGYAQQGARWLHVVDLDAARDGVSQARGLIGQLAQLSGLLVQTGGGVRSEADVEALLELGVARVVVGSVAVREPARVLRWLAEYGSERVCVALDTRADAAGVYRLPLDAWTRDSATGLNELLDLLSQGALLKHVLCTDIARDGMLAGPSVELYRLLLARAPAIALQASGGVRDVADIVAVRALGCAGAIVGKALLDRRVGLAELLEC